MELIETSIQIQNNGPGVEFSGIEINKDNIHKGGNIVFETKMHWKQAQFFAARLLQCAQEARQYEENAKEWNDAG